MFIISGKGAAPPAQMVSGKSTGLSIWGLRPHSQATWGTQATVFLVSGFNPQRADYSGSTYRVFFCGGGS